MRAKFAKPQTPPWMRNICYIALKSILTNKCLRTPSNSTRMPERWGNFSTMCHRNNNNINTVQHEISISNSMYWHKNLIYVISFTCPLKKLAVIPSTLYISFCKARVQTSHIRSTYTAHFFMSYIVCANLIAGKSQTLKGPCWVCVAFSNLHNKEWKSQYTSVE